MLLLLLPEDGGSGMGGGMGGVSFFGVTSRAVDCGGSSRTTHGATASQAALSLVHSTIHAQRAEYARRSAPPVQRGVNSIC